MKLNILFATLILVFSASSQDFNEANRWSIGLNVGGQDFHNPINTRAVKFYEPTYFNFHTRYMMTNRFGIRLNTGYHMLLLEEKPNVQMYSVSFDGVFNLGDLFRFDTWTKKFGLLGHAGVGLAGMWQKGYFQELGFKPQNPLLNVVDDSFSFSVGIMPQYKLSEKFSLNFDMTYVQHALQSRFFDWEVALPDRGFNANFMKFSLGVTMYLGDKARHLDWTPTEYGSAGELRNEIYESKLQRLERMTIDDDKDGVPNYRDEEPNTPEGSLVDSKGRALIDSDGDGIPDEFDKCPMQPGLWSMDGCPDTDGDGVPDHKDLCPEVPGLLMNKGCPEIDKTSQEIINTSIKNVQFEINNANLTEETFEVLDKVRDLLKIHPEYSLIVEGHTCSDGREEFNDNLSKERAERVKMYLVAKGIDEKRITAKWYGPSRPIADNKTEEGKMANRRTEFKIIF